MDVKEGRVLGTVGILHMLDTTARNLSVRWVGGPIDWADVADFVECYGNCEDTQGQGYHVSSHSGRFRIIMEHRSTARARCTTDLCNLTLPLYPPRTPLGGRPCRLSRMLNSTPSQGDHSTLYGRLKRMLQRTRWVESKETCLVIPVGISADC